MGALLLSACQAMVVLVVVQAANAAREASRSTVCAAMGSGRAAESGASRRRGRIESRSAEGGGKPPTRRVVLAWRRSFTRYEAIAALRNAIYACPLPGVTRLS